MKELTIGTFEARLLLAFLLGAIIGLERQFRHKLAGIKTNSLVAGGAALFILLSEKITGDASGPARIAAQIVTGIGFLGAGIIMREGLSVTGLNTSATIWCSGAIGSLAGMGWWYEASVGAAFVIITNIILRPISDRLDKRITRIEASGNRYTVKINAKPDALNDVRPLLMGLIDRIDTLHISAIKVDEKDEMQVSIRSLDRRQSDIEMVMKELGGMENVLYAGWEEYPIG